MKTKPVTPLPWKTAEVLSDSELGIVSIPVIESNKHHAIHQISTDAWICTARATDATLITQSVNEHEALLAIADAANKAQADRWVNEAVLSGREDTIEWLHDLRAALATLERIRKP